METEDLAYWRFKTILLGAAAVGKTSLLHRYVNDRFAENYMATIGVDFLSKEVDFNDFSVKLTIWDLAGQDKFKFLRKNFYAGTSGALLVYDLTREQTFKEINNWYQEMKEFLAVDVPFILIGNKSDLVKDKERSVNEDTAKNLAFFLSKHKHKSLYIETSAKTGENVEKAFVDLIHLMAKEKNQVLE